MGKTLVQGSTPRIRHVHQDDDGNPIDISLNDELIIRIELPDGTRVDRTGILHTSGTDGAHYYDFVPADSAQSGLYKSQGRVHLTSGKQHNTEVQSFYIYPSLAAPSP